MWNSGVVHVTPLLTHQSFSASLDCVGSVLLETLRTLLSQLRCQDVKYVSPGARPVSSTAGLDMDTRAESDTVARSGILDNVAIGLDHRTSGNLERENLGPEKLYHYQIT